MTPGKANFDRHSGVIRSPTDLLIRPDDIVAWAQERAPDPEAFRQMAIRWFGHPENWARPFARDSTSRRAGHLGQLPHLPCAKGGRPGLLQPCRPPFLETHVPCPRPLKGFYSVFPQVGEVRF